MGSNPCAATSTMNLQCYLPEFITRTFRINTDMCGVRGANVLKTLSSEQVDAYQFYDGLMGKSPDTPLSFTAYETDAQGRKTGRSGKKTTSIKKLALLDDDWQSKTSRLQTIMDRMVRDGIVSYAPLSDPDKALMLRGLAAPVTSQTRDPMMADPTGIMRAPWRAQAGQIADPYHPSDPRGVPGWYPNVTNSTPKAYLTPRVLSRSDVPANQLRTYYQDLILACHGHLKARNAPMVFHPLAVAAQAHIFPSRNAYSNVDGESGSRAIREWADNNNDLNYLLQHTVLGFRFPDGDQTQGPLFGGGESHWLWEKSLEVRFPLTIATGTIQSRGALDNLERRTSYPIWTADPLLELQRWVNVATALLSTGDAARDPKAAMVDLFACQAVYSGAQVAAYQQINRPLGSNVLGYRERIATEAMARKAAQRGSLGVPGYQSEGDDTADISMGIIGSVALAAADGLKAGGFPAGLIVGVVSFVIRGCALMITFLGGPDTEPNPFDYPIRMGGRGTPTINGLTVKNCLELPPCYRVR
jgi:hypothetical protein